MTETSKIILKRTLAAAAELAIADAISNGRANPMADSSVFKAGILLVLQEFSGMCIEGFKEGIERMSSKFKESIKTDKIEEALKNPKVAN